jgi:hypothetical protein
MSACIAAAMLAGMLSGGARVAHAAMAATTPTYPPSYYIPRPTYYEPPFPPNSPYGTYWIPDRPVANSGARHRPHHSTGTHPRH